MGLETSALFKVASASMLLGMFLGAKFGHAGKLKEEGATLFQKAQIYNISNVIGLIAASLKGPMTTPLKIAGTGFLLGQLMFVAPLYYQAANGKIESKVKFMVPLGGTAMMSAWLAMMFV